MKEIKQEIVEWEKELNEKLTGWIDAGEIDEGVWIQNEIKEFIKKQIEAAYQRGKEEGYKKGQDDAFRGKIENFKTIEINETVNVPEALREYFRKEGYARGKEETLREAIRGVKGLKDEYPYSIWKPLPHDWTKKLDKWCQTQGWRIDRVSAEYARINHKRIKNSILATLTAQLNKK